MTNDITWIIDFRSNLSSIDSYDIILQSIWCKKHHIQDLIKDEFTEDKVKSYFENYSYRDHIRDFWDVNLVKNPNKINVFFIANDNEIENASLFSYYLKSNTEMFLNQIGGLSSLSCHLISYWESSWSKDDEKIKVNYLYLLNLYQNIPDIKKRPFDYVFIFKDINSGIEKYEYRFRANSSNEYFNSKISALIYHISNVNQELIRKNNNLDKWCISFGSSVIYLDSESLYFKTAKELTDLLLNDLVSNENKPWEIQEDKPLIEKIKGLEFLEVFNSIKYLSSKDVSSEKSFFTPELASLWDWFGLSKLKDFFTKYIVKILLLLKQSKVEYLFDNYNLMRSEVDYNYTKLIEFKNINIKTPQIIFEEYFELKPFSFQAYRKGIENLISLIDSHKKQNLEEFKSLYSNTSKGGYIPCSMNSEVSSKYQEISKEMNDKDGLLLNETVDNQILKIKEQTENIPHPLSLILKTSFMSTILVLLSYIPLMNALSDKSLLVYSLLSVIFLIPYIIIWQKFKNNVLRLSELSYEFEALSKYYISRKLCEYINKKIDAVYEEYQNNCKNELIRVENKIKESENYISSIQDKKSIHPDTFSVRGATSIAEKIPPIRITIDGNHFESKDLKGDTDKLFQYFKQTLLTSKIGFNDFLNKSNDQLNNLIIEQLKSSSENISSASDLLFPKEGVNIKNEDKELILNLLPPFNSGLANDDNVTREILIDSYKIEDDNLISEVFSNGFKTNIHRYISNESVEISNGSISILNINQSFSNVFGLFSTSLGGNKISFIQTTEGCQLVNNEKFMNILQKVIYDTIMSKNIDTTDKREEVFNSVMKGFDLNFDDSGWQSYISDFDLIDNSFVKEFRKLFKVEFERLLSEYLNKNLRNYE